MEPKAFNKVKGYSKLTENQAKFFQRMHKKHMSAMGTDNQIKYALENLKKIVWDKKLDCLKVYYQDIWWHYDKRGCWY